MAAREALRDADGIDASDTPPRQEAAALVLLASALHVTGQVPAAHAVVTRALTAARTIGDARQRCAALLEVLPQVDPGTAEKIRVEAQQTALEIDDPAARTRGLAAVVRATPDPTTRDALIAGAMDAVAADDDPAFWMPSDLRAAMLAELRTELGSQRLGETTVDIGRNVIQAARRGIPVSRVLRRWSDIAHRIGRDVDAVDAAAALLDTKVEQALRAGDLPEAMGWVSAGEDLARTLGGELDSVVRRGNRRIELVYRQTQDARHLEHFLDRSEQVAAFDALMAPGGAWALHYLGMGGVGKTMLLRHVARLAAQRGLAYSRVDFDHLNPAYPAERPAQLLLDLMEELQTYATTDHEEGTIRAFANAVVRLHEGLMDRLGRGRGLAALDRPDSRPRSPASATSCFNSARRRCWCSTPAKSSPGSSRLGRVCRAWTQRSRSSSGSRQRCQRRGSSLPGGGYSPWPAQGGTWRAAMTSWCGWACRSARSTSRCITCVATPRRRQTNTWSQCGAFGHRRRSARRSSRPALTPAPRSDSISAASERSRTRPGTTRSISRSTRIGYAKRRDSRLRPYCRATPICTSSDAYSVASDRRTCARSSRPRSRWPVLIAT